MGTAGVGVTVQGQGVNAVISNTVTGCAAGTVSGSGCEQGAKTAALMSTAGEAYQSIVGYAANPGPGENRNGTKLDGTSTGNGTYEPVDKIGPNYGQQQVADRGMNVIGFNDPAKIGSIGAQGSAISRVLNQVPFINATAGLHDYIFNSNPDLNFALWNVPSMVPSAALSIPAALNNPNYFWITQVKKMDQRKQPTIQSIIRIDNSSVPQINLKLGVQK